MGTSQWDDMVTWVRKRICLKNFNPDDSKIWNETHTETVTTFLASPSSLKLLIAYDSDNNIIDDRVVMSTGSLPPLVLQKCDEIAYFLRKNKETVNSCNISILINYGTVASKQTQKTLKIAKENIYRPLIFDSTSLMESSRKQLLGRTFH